MIVFHVAFPDFPINTDGILGREYLHQEKVEISFWHNTIVRHSKPTKPIPSVGIESKTTQDQILDYKGTGQGKFDVKKV